MTRGRGAGIGDVGGAAISSNQGMDHRRRGNRQGVDRCLHSFGHGSGHGGGA